MIVYSIQQNGSNTTATSTRNNRGSAVMGGNSSSTVLRNRPFNAQPVGVFNSKPALSATVGNAKSLSSGVFAYNSSKPITVYVTTSLATVSKTALRTPASVPALTKSINSIEAITTNKTATAFRAGFNLFTGQYSGSVTTQTDSFGNDNAARPTRSVPGQLVYMIGNKVPTTSNYKPKTAG